MSPRVRILLFTTLLYAATLTLGVLSAERLSIPGGPQLPQLELTLTDAAIFLAVFIVFTLAMLKFARLARTSLGTFLFIVMVMGARFVFAGWLETPYDWVAALALVGLTRASGLVIVHDIAIAFGIGGVSALLGLSITPLVAALLLAMLSIYDIYSVYRTRHMVVLAGRMLESGAVFGFLVPARFSVFFSRVPDALTQRSVMMLGSGDIGLPIVLAASAVTSSMGAAISVSLGALLGVLLMQTIWMRQEKPAPMAALPPIAALSILGYLVAVLLGI